MFRPLRAPPFRPRRRAVGSGDGDVTGSSQGLCKPHTLDRVASCSRILRALRWTWRWRLTSEWSAASMLAPV